jgi:NtrC-family two-component system sensor histidine kinase KinB
MVLKTKLSLGLGLLFLIILALAGFCSYHVERLARDAENILKDNYNSLVYSKNMFSALDDMRTSVSVSAFNPSGAGIGSDYYREMFESGRTAFEANLKAENGNITEIDEKGYVERLNRSYEVYLALCLRMRSDAARGSVYFTDLLPAYEDMKQSIGAISDINMQAVARKSQLARRDSAHFVTSMAVVGAFCILLAFGYFWYFPFYVSNTMSYLATRMRALLKHTGGTLDLDTNDEAYVILQAINVLENKLGVTVEGEDAKRRPKP